MPSGYEHSYCALFKVYFSLIAPFLKVRFKESVRPEQLTLLSNYRKRVQLQYREEIKLISYELDCWDAAVSFNCIKDYLKLFLLLLVRSRV